MREEICFVFKNRKEKRKMNENDEIYKREIRFFYV